MKRRVFLKYSGAVVAAAAIPSEAFEIDVVPLVDDGDYHSITLGPDTVVMNWPDNILWQDGHAPALSEGTDIVKIMSPDDCKTWYSNYSLDFK